MSGDFLDIYMYTLVFLVITETKLSKVWSMVGHEKAEKAQKKKGRCDFFFLIIILNYHSSSKTNQIQL